MMSTNFVKFDQFTQQSKSYYGTISYDLRRVNYQYITTITLILTLTLSRQYN